MMANDSAAGFSTLIDQLSAEHAELLPHTDQILDLAGGDKAALREAIAQCVGRLRTPLEAHIAQEDDVLFPAFARASGDEGLVGQFRDEHRVILALRDDMLAALESDDSRKLGTLAAQFADLLGSHMRREDLMLFPSAREALSADESANARFVSA